MQPEQGYNPLDSAFPLRGLDSISPSTMMHPSYSPDILNMMIRDGVYRSRSGYEQVGAAISGTAIYTEEFIAGNGTKYLVVVTTTREYVYDGTNNEWDEVTSGFGVVTAFRTGATEEIDMTGDFTLVYTSGKNIVVTGATNGGNNATFTVVSSSLSAGTTTVIVTETVTAEASPPAACRARNEKTGTETDVIDSCQGTDSSGTYLFITNDVDCPRYWNGSGNFLLANATALSYTNFNHCKTLEIIDDYLVLGNVTVSSSPNLTTIAWSDTLDFFEHTSGNAATMLFTDAVGEIMTIKKLSDNAAVYCENSVHLLEHIGGDALFGQERRFRDVAPVGPRALVDLGPYHIFLAQDRFWVFDGTRLVRPFGEDTIAEKIRADLDDELKSRVFGFNDAPFRHAYFVIPRDETSSTILVTEYNIANFQNSKWMVLEYTHRPTSIGWYSRHDDLTWAGLQTANATLNWEDWAFGFAWRDRGIKQGFRSRVMASTTAVYRCEENLSDDAGTGFTSREETLDFSVPEGYVSINGRWIELEVELLGESVDMEYSTDQGASWTFLTDSDGANADGVTLTPTWTKYKFHLDVVAQLLRIRLSCPDAKKGFSRRFVRLWVTPGGSR